MLAAGEKWGAAVGRYLVPIYYRLGFYSNWDFKFTKFILLFQVFSRAEVFFSIGGRQFAPEPVSFSYMPDVIIEHARNVTVKLHQRIGRFLKVQLYFGAKFLLVSEISFDSGKFVWF